MSKETRLALVAMAGGTLRAMRGTPLQQAGADLVAGGHAYEVARETPDGEQVEYAATERTMRRVLAARCEEVACDPSACPAPECPLDRCLLASVEEAVAFRAGVEAMVNVVAAAEVSLAMPGGQVLVLQMPPHVLIDMGGTAFDALDQCFPRHEAEVRDRERQWERHMGTTVKDAALDAARRRAEDNRVVRPPNDGKVITLPGFRRR